MVFLYMSGMFLLVLQLEVFMITFFAVLFFVTVIVIPFSVTFIWGSPENSLGDLTLLFVFFATLVGYTFRVRLKGRGVIARVYAFDYCEYLAFGAGLSAVSGAMMIDGVTFLSSSLIMLAVVSTIVALVRGPVCGWAHYLE